MEQNIEPLRDVRPHGAQREDRRPLVGDQFLGQPLAEVRRAAGEQNMQGAAQSYEYAAE